MQKSCFAKNSQFLTKCVSTFSLEKIFQIIFSPKCLNCNSLLITYCVSWDILPWGYRTIGFHLKIFDFSILRSGDDISGTRGPTTSRTPAKDQPFFPLSRWANNAIGFAILLSYLENFQKCTCFNNPPCIFII